ncbi:MAG: hypothetical protein ACLFUW_00420 [Bacteroidales bacterium]
MKNNFGIGSTSIYKILNELIKENLCIRFQHNFYIDKEGKIRPGKGDRVIIISAQPLTNEEKIEYEKNIRTEFIEYSLMVGHRYCVEEKHEEFKKKLLLDGILHAGFVHAGSGQLNNIDKKIHEKDTLHTNDVDCSKAPKDEKEPAFLQGSGLSKKDLINLIKKFPANKVEEAIRYLKAQDYYIKNPYGFVVRCIENNWYENDINKKKKATQFIENNKNLAKKVERLYNPVLKINCEFQAKEKSLILVRGKNIHECLYSSQRFQEQVKKLLKEMDLNPKEINL